MSESKLQAGNRAPLSGDVGGGPVPHRGGHGSQALEPGLFKNDYHIILLVLERAER